MSRLQLAFHVTIVMLIGSNPLRADVIRQQPGTDYLVVEAEDYESLEGDEFSGFLEVEPNGEFETAFGSQVLPEDTNASGNAIYDQPGGGNFVDLATYQLQFETPGIYSLYLRSSMFEEQNDTDYGNEDSLYLPLALDELPEQTGWYSLPKLGHNDPIEDPPFWEGQFHWDAAAQVRESSDVPNEIVEYEVTPNDVGTVLDFAISTRERGTTVDAMIFSMEPFLFPEELDELLFDNPPAGIPGDFNDDRLLTEIDIDLLSEEIRAQTNQPSFDLNKDAVVDDEDHRIWIKDLKNTWFGDANLDGEFNSGDLVAVFTSGKYEQEQAAGWREGDWDANMFFDSGDLVKAFSDGGYELGPRTPANAVPEPSGLLMLFGTMLVLAVRRT